MLTNHLSETIRTRVFGKTALSIRIGLIGRPSARLALLLVWGIVFPPHPASTADGQTSLNRLGSPDASGRQDPPAEDSVERDYAGELPRIPPTEPVAALETFRLHEGFRIEQVAAEPLVTDPVAMAFDEQGRLFVIEMRGYSEDAEQHLGVVRLLEDADGDGTFEKSTLFAEGLSWPTAVACYDGGVFVGAAPDIHYMKDTDHDGRADQKSVVLTGFGRSNVQGLLNSFQWGLDNRIHAATSSSGGLVAATSRPDSAPLDLRGRDFAWNPRTMIVEATSGGAQHGLSFDRWGRKFVCSNSDHIQLVQFEDRYVARNPHLAAPGPRRSIAEDGPAADVFRISPVEPWRIVRTRLRVKGLVPGPIEGGGTAAGYFTSATGVTVYRGHVFPADFRDNVFIGDVGSNLVHRKSLVPQGFALVARRADCGREFLASTDIWFRPVQFANAPDGALYIADMYREVIEHPASLPPLIKKHLDLTSGRDRGRIYRIVPRDFKQPDLPRLRTLSIEQWVDLLDHPNGWHRETAQRLLFEANDPRAIELLRRQGHHGKSPEGRIAAIYLLRDMTALTAPWLEACLDDPHPRVREHAIRAAEALAAKYPSLAGRIGAKSADEDPYVRLQTAFTLGEFPPPARIAPLAELAKRDVSEPLMRVAIQSSLAEGADLLLAELIRDPAYRAGSEGRRFLAELARQIGARRDHEEQRNLLTSLKSLVAPR
jgi:putative membrane-bound dehydrogenase-like protein